MSDTIFDAVKSGDMAQLNAALQQSGAVEARGEMNMTPLMLAASLGNLEMVRALLKAGADPKARNEGGRTALMMVKEKDYIEVINMLHEAESNIEVAEDGGGCGSRHPPGWQVGAFLTKGNKEFIC